MTCHRPGCGHTETQHQYGFDHREGRITRGRCIVDGCGCLQLDEQEQEASDAHA